MKFPLTSTTLFVLYSSVWISVNLVICTRTDRAMIVNTVYVKGETKASNDGNDNNFERYEPNGFREALHTRVRDVEDDIVRRELTLNEDIHPILPMPRKPPSEGISACLLIKDDNHRLIEWLAYHYHVLPLRHLIVAVDPESKTSPLPILERYDNDTELEYILWNDEDYIPPPKIMSRYERKLQAFLKRNDPSDALTKLHRERQQIFLSQCYKKYRLMNHSWVVHVDTDEFLVFNTMEKGEPRFDESKRPVVANPERMALSNAGRKTALEVIQARPREPCMGMVRLLFGAIEASESEMKAQFNHSPSLARKLDTLRFFRHATKGQPESVKMKTKRMNGLGKVLVDVSRLSDEDLAVEKIYSIHRPFKNLCPAHYLGPQAYVESIFRVNHYLGSWEAYDARVDVRRDKETFDRKAKVNEGTSYDIIPWLTSFVEEVGVQKANDLLEGVGEIATETNLRDQSTEKEEVSETAGEGCALIFFGLSRKFKEVSFPSIKKYILDANPSCDVFAHTFNVTKAQGTRAFEDGSKIDASEIYLLSNSSENIMLQTEEDFQQKRNVSLFRSLFPRPAAWEYPISMDNMIRQWHSIEGAWSVMETREEMLRKKYDRVGLFRSDVLYTHPIRIDDVSESAVIPSMMYKPKTVDNSWKGYNDRMFYGDRAFAEVWATGRFDSVGPFLRWQRRNPNATRKTGLHSEMFMQYLLTIHRPMPLTIKDICFQRVRSSGKILVEDCSLREDGENTVSGEMPISNGARGVIVLGMHRSGTSLLTGLLAEALSLKTPGQHVQAKIKEQNPSGFFENKDLKMQNDEWLEQQGMSWDYLKMRTDPLDSSKVSGRFDPSFDSITDHGKEAITAFNNPANSPYVMKDPRLCLTLKKWLPFLAGSPPPILFTYRNPLDVALSLHARKRNSVPVRDGLRLWIWYNREAIRLSANMCRVVTSNDLLLKDATNEVIRIRRELANCGLDSGTTDLDKVKQFIKSDFQHGVIDESDVCDSSIPNVDVLENEEGREMYKKSIRVFCDLRSGNAFNVDYVWPTLV